MSDDKLIRQNKKLIAALERIADNLWPVGDKVVVGGVQTLRECARRILLEIKKEETYEQG